MTVKNLSLTRDQAAHALGALGGVHAMNQTPEVMLLHTFEGWGYSMVLDDTGRAVAEAIARFKRGETDSVVVTVPEAARAAECLQFMGRHGIFSEDRVYAETGDYLHEYLARIDPCETISFGKRTDEAGTFMTYSAEPYTPADDRPWEPPACQHVPVEPRVGGWWAPGPGDPGYPLPYQLCPIDPIEGILPLPNATINTESQERADDGAPTRSLIRSSESSSTDVEKRRPMRSAASTTVLPDSAAACGPALAAGQPVSGCRLFGRCGRLGVVDVLAGDLLRGLAGGLGLCLYRHGGILPFHVGIVGTDHTRTRLVCARGTSRELCWGARKLSPPDSSYPESDYPLTEHIAAVTPQTKPFLLPAPVWDAEWAGLVLAEDATHRWILLSFGYNMRLITVPHGERNGWDYGWCYPRDTAAVLAALEGYDPDAQDEPMGWHKRPGAAVRQAPRWEENPECNRPRCQHGAYHAAECRDQFCPDFAVDQQGNDHQGYKKKVA